VLEDGVVPDMVALPFRPLLLGLKVKPLGPSVRDSVVEESEYASNDVLKYVDGVVRPRLVPVVHVGGLGLFDFP